MRNWRRLRATVISYEEALGIDTDVPFGAILQKLNILLFIDGDFLIPSSDLLPFCSNLFKNGTDLALNNIRATTYMYRVPYISYCM